MYFKPLLFILWLVQTCLGCQSAQANLQTNPITPTAGLSSASAALARQFQQLIYGILPAHLQIKGSLERQGRLSQSGFAFAEHRLELRFEGKTIRTLHLLQLTPDLKHSKHRPSPPLRLLFLNKCGNQALLPDPEIRPSAAIDQGDPICQGERGHRGGEASGWQLAEALHQGFELWTLHESEIAPDQPTAFQHSLAALGQQIPLDAKAPPGLLALWAWGLSHVLDYLAPDSAHPVGLMGHSRRGKAALLTAALDPRVAWVIPHQSGTLGAVSVQNHPAESLESILTFFPHWFTPGLQHWRGRAEELPLNQAQLIALVAPRPVLISEGLLDLWASPGLSLLSLQQARPAWQPVWPTDSDSLESYLSWAPQPQRLNAPLVHLLAWTGHVLAPDWQVVKAFGDAHFSQSDK